MPTVQTVTENSETATSLVDLRAVVCGPLVEIAARFSGWTMNRYPHSAMIIFTRECTGRPKKVSGDPAIVDRVTIAELEVLKGRLSSDEPVVDDEATVGNQRRRTVGMLDEETDTLLVIVPRNTAPRFSADSEVGAAFGLVATSIRHQVVQASPAYLAESLAASSERARAISEMADAHAATLATLLSTLRSKDLSDLRARNTASDTASAALIALRSTETLNRELAHEAVTTAFARLRGELGPMLADHPIDVEYVEPPADGRAVPGEIARAARAIVRTVALSYVSHADVRRIRIAWDCDGSNLLLELRDDAEQSLDMSYLSDQLTGRVHTLRGTISFESVPGWGSRVNVTLPLDPPASPPDEHLLASLNPRELDVLGHVATGKRNRDIAAALGIGESTVKFHVAGILKKLGVATRGEAGALGIEAGIKAGTANGSR